MDGAQQTDGNTRSKGMSAPETGKVPRKGHKSLKWANEAKQIQAELEKILHRKNYRVSH